jgi:hypothetical protein
MSVYFDTDENKIFVIESHLDMYLQYEHLIWIGDL